jgi:hypothetical protein
MISLRYFKACLLVLPFAASAQDALQTVETSRQSADAVLTDTGKPAQSPSAKPKTLDGGTSEFGELVVMKEQSAAFDPWRARLSMQGFYTDNAALAPREEPDFFIHGRLDVSYVNRLSGAWNFEAQLSQDWLRYDKFDSLDFDIAGFRTGVFTKLPWLASATFSLSYDLLHISEAGWGDAITTSNAITAAIHKSWAVAAGQTLQFGLASQPEFHTEPDFAQRHDHSTYAAWSSQLADRLTLRLLGRATYRTRPNVDREDWNFVTRLALAWKTTDHFTVTASSGITWNLSSKDRFDYTNHLSGVFLTADYRF